MVCPKCQSSNLKRIGNLICCVDCDYTFVLDKDCLGKTPVYTKKVPDECQKCPYLVSCLWISYEKVKDNPSFRISRIIRRILESRKLQLAIELTGIIYEGEEE